MKRLEKKKRRAWPWIIAACLVIAAVVAVVYLTGDDSDPEDPGDTQVPAAEQVQNLGHGLYLLSVDPYSGPYVEDGSDEPVENVMAITVENQGDEPIQLSTVTLTAADGAEYSFTLTALPAGARVTVLEENRAAYKDGLEISGAVLSNVAGFNEPLSLHEELLSITASNQTLTIKNVSGQAFPGGRVCYKNVSNDGYLGGITYTVTIPAMAADEEVTLYAGHYTTGGSELLFVTYAA